MTVTASHDCGWTGGPYRSQAQADYALHAHSCERHHARQARAARVAARKAADGPERPCTHNGRHDHGTQARYVLDRCRCRACRDASAAYERRRYRDLAYGRPRLVDATPAREHIVSLQAAGMGWKTIAEAAGVGVNVVGKMLYGDPRRGMPPTRRIRPGTAERILAVRPAPKAGIAVDSTGTARRLQALAALGWSGSLLARQLGLSPSNFGRLLTGSRGTTIATRDAVTALYDRLWDTPPPQDEWRAKISAASTRRRAREAGWALPMAWDDDTIDDPCAVADTTRPTASGRGRPADDVADDIAFLLDQDLAMTVEQAGHRLRLTPDAVYSALRRAGRPDLIDTLRHRTATQKGTAA